MRYDLEAAIYADPAFAPVFGELKAGRQDYEGKGLRLWKEGSTR